MLANLFHNRLYLIGLLVFPLAGCQNMNNTQKGAMLGAAGGAGLGAIIGNQMGNAGAGALIGTLAGTATGALAGNAKDEADRRDSYARQAAYERNRRYYESRMMSNREVYEMSSLGIPDRVICGAIQERGGYFDTSPQGLMSLYRAGVSDTVLQAMQQANRRY